jgi:hypothetical protein
MPEQSWTGLGQLGLGSEAPPGLMGMMQQYRPPTGLDPNDHRSISYPAGGAAQEIMNNTYFPVDPYSIEFAAGGGETGQGRFVLNGQDLFGGVLPRDMLPSNTLLRDIPRNLQPLLAPALTRFYRERDYAGGASRGEMSAPWTRFYAPNNGVVSPGSESTWPGITRLDPWGRSMGEYANLY